MTARIYLFVPGDNAARLAGALERGADAVIADLEDSVVPDAKSAARSLVAGWLAERSSPAVERWVRVNAGALLAPDVAALGGTDLVGIVVPKVAGPEDVTRAIGALDAAGLAGAEVIPLIETAAAFVHLDAIAGVARVRQLMIGEMDLGAELGISPHSEAWTVLRVQVVVASAAAGLPAPIGPVDARFEDQVVLRQGTRRLSEMGFGSRAAIHPAQIAPFREGLMPDPDDVARARDVIAAAAAAQAEGRGAAVDPDGRMVDEPIVGWARRTLEAAGDDETP